MALDQQLIRDSFALVADQADKVSSHFYAVLFTESPELRDMFPPMMDAQRSRLFSALIRVVHDLESTEQLTEYLQQLGRDHRKFGVKVEHYALLQSALVRAMRRYAGDAWTPAMDDAWAEAYRLIAAEMIFGAEESAKTAPPWWNATVVEHETRGRDVAVITLRPDQPLSYRAGQYVSLETTRWPRVWRYYSMANAPRPDGLVTLHVRAVGAGWVSSALVYHTNVGDVVRLGSPMGGMVCNTASNRPVLCVAGGTGLAPLKALIEDMSRWNTNRRVRLYIGARRADDLYDMSAVESLVEELPWLSVAPVVSEDPTYQGDHGLVSEQVARDAPRFDDFASHDAYVSGSAEMVRATIEQLRGLGMPLSRMRFDAYSDGDDVYTALNEQERQRRNGGPPVLTPENVAAAASERSSQLSVDYWVARAAAVRGRAARAAGGGDAGADGEPAGAEGGSPGAAAGGGWQPDTAEPPKPAGSAAPRAFGPQLPASQASKSSESSAERGTDWQASTNPSYFSSGSRA